MISYDNTYKLFFATFKDKEIKIGNLHNSFNWSMYFDYYELSDNFKVPCFLDVIVANCTNNNQVDVIKNAIISLKPSGLLAIENFNKNYDINYLFDSFSFTHLSRDLFLAVKKADQYFDENYYLANNPDVALAVHKKQFPSGFDHWLLYGKTENRRPKSLTRTDIINKFIKARGYKSYLEIGVAACKNFKPINIHTKIGVDIIPSQCNTLVMSSDEFFIRNKLNFDIIFIDGLHEEVQVLRDIENSLLFLNPGGVIILHDCLPPNEWAARDTYNDDGTTWNGTTWKAVLRFFNSTNYARYIVDTDWGCGVIDTSNEYANQNVLNLPSQLSYAEHFPLLKSYILREKDF